MRRPTGLSTEERAAWLDSDEGRRYVEEAELHPVRLVPTRSLVPIAMRMPEELIEWLRSEANPLGMGYQTLARQLLMQHMLGHAKASTTEKARPTGQRPEGLSEEERAAWLDSDEGRRYVDEADLHPVRLAETRRLVPITMRVPEELVMWLRSEAALLGMGYQTLARQLLMERMLEGLTTPAPYPAEPKPVDLPKSAAAAQLPVAIFAARIVEEAAGRSEDARARVSCIIEGLLTYVNQTGTPDHIRALARAIDRKAQASASSTVGETPGRATGLSRASTSRSHVADAEV